MYLENKFCALLDTKEVQLDEEKDVIKQAEMLFNKVAIDERVDYKIGRLEERLDNAEE